MDGLLLGLLLAASAAAQPDARKPPSPLPAKPAAEEYRVVVDYDVSSRDDSPPPSRAGVRFQGQGRLLSVDPGTRRVILENEDGGEETFTVPDAARLSFAGDRRPLKLDQFRRGDPVGYTVDGEKAVRLHLDLCGEGVSTDEDNIFARPRPRRSRRRPPPPPLEDEETQYRTDEPDVPMYQTEPPEPPRTPRRALKK
jgi:hypothetical protein